jgi:hypothetical protein
MEVFTWLGLCIGFLTFCFFMAHFIAITLDRTARVDADSYFKSYLIGLIIVVIALGVVLSAFFAKPKMFGYEIKAISVNSVEEIR